MGKLFVVATPIGNLADFTFRAVEILQSVDVIAAEDTRHTKKLLRHYNIATPLQSYHAHSSPHKTASLIARLDTGDDIALVTDAGTPAISDPGSGLVAHVQSAGHTVITIPGPSAVTAALSISGLGGDHFTFVGFLPQKKGRQTLLRKLRDCLQPVVLYESPYRLVKLLGELTETYPNAEVAVARELTKTYEELQRATPSELLAHYSTHPVKGELVVVVKI